MAEHTPTPWHLFSKIGGQRAGHYGYAVEILAADDTVVCRVPKRIGSANAAFIVNAVNNHEPLVKALQCLDDACDKLASLRTQEMYLAMLDAGHEFALADLQDARNEAVRALAAVRKAGT